MQVLPYIDPNAERRKILLSVAASEARRGVFFNRKAVAVGCFAVVSHCNSV